MAMNSTSEAEKKEESLLSPQSVPQLKATSNTVPLISEFIADPHLLRGEEATCFYFIIYKTLKEEGAAYKKSKGTWTQEKPPAARTISVWRMTFPQFAQGAVGVNMQFCWGFFSGTAHAWLEYMTDSCKYFGG